MIKNIIFDLGNVLVNVLYERFREKIYSHNISKETYDNFFLDGNYRLLGYEAGTISTNEFVSKCLDGLELNMKRDDFIGAFNDMFTEITPMKEILQKLSKENNYDLFLLSNTSPLHFDYVRKRFEYLNLIHMFGLSYELKSLKPELEIYERAIESFGVKPEECLFIDDLEENCIGAAKFGIKTITYDKKNHARFVRDFENCLNYNI